LVVIALFIFIAALAPQLMPHDYVQIDLSNRLSAPTDSYWLGTDQFGRDLLSRLIIGARVSLLVGVLATSIAAMGGILIGSVAAWSGRVVDTTIMRIMDVLLAFPTIVVAIALAAVLGAGLDKVIMIISITRIPQFARIARGAVLTVKEADYVMAASALGRRGFVVLFRHVLPNCIAPLIVYASFSVAAAINTEAALSFLGLGIQPPHASWGTMLSDARNYMLLSPWIAIFPGAAITITVSAFNILGDGFRDLADPRSGRLVKGRG